MKIDLLIPILRQILHVIVGLMVMHGIVDQSIEEPLTGAVIGIIATGWWLFDRQKINKANKKAGQVAGAVAEVAGVDVKDLPATADVLKSVVKSKLGKVG